MNVRILSSSAGPRAIALEVTEKGRRVVSQITKVDSFSSLLQQQQSVEDLEEFGRRLMNPGGKVSTESQIRNIAGSDSRAENGLPVISQSPEETHDGPSALRIQSGSWLV